jgi:hypothetical protein
MEMRYVIAAALVLVVSGTPSFADKRPNTVMRVDPTPTFDECFRLAWVRGVHVERGELDVFNEDCKANHVPFETGNPSDSIVRKAH